MHTITFCSFKGGTSKASTALHVGAGLAKFHKKKVLLVDFDSQANLSIGLRVGPDSEATMVPVLQDSAGIKDVIRTTQIDGLALVAANAYLDGIEKTPQLGTDPYAHERLRRALEGIRGDYDYCFIDTPPSLSWLTQSAFFASQSSLICAIPEAFSIIALKRLREFHDSICRYHPVEVLGVVLSFWDERGAANETFLEHIEKSFPGKIFGAKIRRDVAVSRAVLHGQTVYDYESGSRAALDYKALSDEFMKTTKKGAMMKMDKLLKSRQAEATR